VIRGFAKCEALSDVDALALVEFKQAGGPDVDVISALANSGKNHEGRSIAGAQFCFEV
jgi:hypothetical protein